MTTAETQQDAARRPRATGPAGQDRHRGELKMEKTVVVAVANTVTHSLYHRSMKRTKKFHAHDEENRCKVGDVVEIVASRPLSKTKRWRVRAIVKRAE